ncbi:putative immunoglobulin-blocking virulence protein [Mesomycoplasma conjunctivae]|uniref:putative immunoglobulin-blocking virulence protein n=1 Tax=Mesomycoplasma conjunctivae TaxID=45361 RepID=UPI003DA40709
MRFFKQRNQIQANKRRFFANSSEWQRTDINSLNYPGWTRSNVSSQFSSINSNLIGVGKPIEFLSYSPSDSEFKSKGDSIIAVLDANSEQAFQEFSSIISQAAQQNVKIKGVVLKNVGSKNSLQNVEQILQKLPTQIVKLTLFLENYRATEGLRGLENHKLQELELYSNSNSVNSNWGINPNSLKNVDYISFDYHNQATYGAGVRVAGSIVFNTLRWDKNDEIQQVNEGLEIAFGSKINQRVFQGSSGGKGGHPVNLDFSSAPKIKSLKGVDFNKVNQLFNDKIKNWEGDKFAQEDFQARNVKFKQLYFAPTQKNGQLVYEANISDFENGQFSTALSWDEPTQPQIYIGTPGNTLVNPTFYLNGKASDLKGNSKSELGWFVRAVGARGSFAKIVVSDPALKSALGGAISGVLVTQESDSAIGSSGNEIIA